MRNRRIKFGRQVAKKSSDEQIDAKMQNNEPRCKSSLWFVPDHYDQNMKNLHIQ